MWATSFCNKWPTACVAACAKATVWRAWAATRFVVLLEGLSESPKEAANQAEVVAHKILDALALPYSLRGHGYNSTPSIGIVVFMEDHETMDDLLKKADVAMYQAKRPVATPRDSSIR